ncbi:DsbA family protein [Methylobacillus sp.]|uniref:DsbA family protein n=1 Tax=Methylobacillus sp. TaxID=56818 RepID=UPI002FE268D4
MSPTASGRVVHYIGDPMCSWCWGIAPAIKAVADFCTAAGVTFRITMGGLRAGGGDLWNAEFKAFLRQEWSKIAQMTGQPFGFTLLDAPAFNYDTEPACRAVVVAQLLQARHHLPPTMALEFLAALQHKFYVDGQDPGEMRFYVEICASLGLDAAEFHEAFESAAAKQQTQQHFMRSREWGVRSFPTLLLERDGQFIPLAVGYVSAEQLLSRLRQQLG